MILAKLQILITQNFKDPKSAFNFFDADGNGRLDNDEITKLLKEAEISGFIRGIVASKLIEGYSKDGDETVSWPEFQAALAEIQTKH